MTEDTRITAILAKKSLGAELTGEEAQLLGTWLHDPTNREFFESALQSGDLLRLAGQTIGLNESRLDQKMDEAISPKPQTKPIRSVKPWLVAASIILFLPMGILLYRDIRHTNRRKDTRANGAAIRPATNRAQLKLANGSILYLDSTRNGQIAIQGSVSVTKKAGEIAYSAPNHTADATGNPAAVTQEMNELLVPRGAVFKLKLPDGTEVWLNSATDISYPVAFGTERRLRLDGEAFFEVAQDPARPFIVETNRGTTRVLGTSFNVNAYTEDSVEMVTVISGAVRFTGADKGMTLHPGEQSVEEVGTLSLEHPNLQAVTAWRRGFFYFQNADIRTIMRQISRFYDVTVRYEGQPSEETYDGLISRDLNLSEALALLSKLNITATLDDKTVTVSPLSKGSHN